MSSLRFTFGGIRLGLFAESRRIFEDPDGAAARILHRQAYSHTVPIIFWAETGPGQEPPAIVGGSGVLVEFRGTPYVITCEHVVRDFRTRRQSGPYVFQIGGLRLDLDQHLTDEDGAIDLALIDVSGLALAQMGNRPDFPLQALAPSRWPPNPVARPGGLVIICGFPGGETRDIDHAARNITSGAFSFIEHVSEVGKDHFLVPFHRRDWVSEFDEPVTQEIIDLNIGGLSGCPVFSGRDQDGGILLLELLGVVLSEIPFADDGVFVRSLNRVSENGVLDRGAISP